MPRLGGRRRPRRYRSVGFTDPLDRALAEEATADLNPQQAAEELLTYVLARPDAVRQRAQYAAATAAVVATAVAVVGGLTSINRFPTPITIALAAAVVLWVVSVFGWVWAIGGPLEPVETYLSPHRRAAYLSRAIACAKANAEIARSRLASASAITGLAMVVTVGAFTAAAVHSEVRDDPVSAVIVLSEKAANATEALCGRPDADSLELHGEIRLVDLSRPLVSIKMPGGDAFEGPALRLRSSSVVLASEIKDGTPTPPKRPLCR